MDVDDDAEEVPALLVSTLVKCKGGSHFGGEFGYITVNVNVC